MIFPVGYMPLSEILDKCIESTRLMHESQTPFDASGPDTSHSEWLGWINHISFFEGVQTAWDFCDRDDALPFTMLANGTVVRVSHKMLRNWAVDPIGTFVDITVGTLGSGSGHYDWKSFSDACEQKDLATLEKFVGPFKNLPVIYENKVAGCFLDSINRWAGATDAPNHSLVAEAIVDAFDRDMRMTKREVRQRFAKNMKQAEFLATWDMAVQRRPELSRPGPKKMK